MTWLCLSSCLSNLHCVYIPHFLCLYTLMDRHLRWFQSVVVVNCAAITWVCMYCYSILTLILRMNHEVFIAGSNGGFMSSLLIKIQVIVLIYISSNTTEVSFLSIVSWVFVTVVLFPFLWGGITSNLNQGHSTIKLTPTFILYFI